MIITFCGHSNFSFSDATKDELKNLLIEKIRKNPTCKFEVNPKSWTKNLIKLLVNEFCTLQDSFLLIYEIFSRWCSSKYIRVNSQ